MPNPYLQEDRRDLIRRVYAVAISVGFAARLIDFEKPIGLEKPRAFQLGQDWPPALQLIVALIIVIFFWDWYHRDIARRQYKGIYRFILDAFIAFASMSFLYVSGRVTLWLFSLALVFVLFVVWDILAIREQPASFEPPVIPAPPPTPTLLAVLAGGIAGAPEQRQPPVPVDHTDRRGNPFRVYLDGVRGPTSENRAPFINLCWMIYFVLLWLVTVFWGARADEGPKVLLACAAAGLGVCLLRKEGEIQDPRRFWSSKRRLVIIAIILFFYWVLRCVAART